MFYSFLEVIANVQVGTAEMFQGSEREVIIISTVRLIKTPKIEILFSLLFS